MSIGVRDLTVLGEFKPFGLVSEELEGKPLETAPEEHQYFLFHADVARERDGPAAATLSSAAVSADLDFSSPSPPSDDGDHEIFIRGSRITWSTGSRVHKRYNSPKTVIMACWCRMEAIPDALLCVLQIDTLSIYGASGEVVCIPLPFAIASIFPLPFGLLLQKAVDGNRRISISGSLLNARDLSRSGKDSGWNHHVFHQLNSFEPVVKENEAITSSHLILRHPLEEPQVRCLLCSARPVAIETPVNPSASDQDLQQSAALVAIGLLYEGSAHPFTMKILLGEIGRRSGGDNVLEREGYAVAAGYALGLVALGRGKGAFGFVDSFVDRLFHYIGEKGVRNEKTSVVSQTTDDHIRILGQMVDGAHINVDVTAPGATIALALIFMKTESEEMVSRLRLPVTHFDLQYVRPDFIMLRVITRNLIMWSNMQPSRNWIESQIPDVIKLGVLRLDGAVDDDEFDAEAVVQAYIKHVPATTNITLPKGMLQYVDRGTSEICLHLIVLSLSLVSLAIGFLFLGGGMQTFSTGNSAVAALLMTLYPRLPTGPSDNRCHLQAFRHLYVIAAESRRVQTLKTVRVCGPRYWPQVIQLIPEARSGVVAIDLDEKDVDNPAAKWVDCPLKRGLD
ncbi:Anaphase-promoting complex subunit [Musa troglodytarum]|uniref:Anaphase-promoting complex subunit n=1 Tax=Musa troglodytarum TaxID=320322 RepID=A0A9E7KTA1_9LILI|nr:Anaphase-promoting complex subunit [Musa troglodytarum]